MMLWMIAVACSGKATPDDGAPVAETPPVEETAPGVDAAPGVEAAPPPPEVVPDTPDAPHPVVATWTSEPCGDRGYVRELTFSPNFRYAGRDLVAPCPPEATCIWDGIVEFGGTWSDDGPMLVLTEDEVLDDGKGAARPSTLRRTQSGHLTESVGDGEACGYAKVD